MMAPAFEVAAPKLEPRVRCVKINTDEEQTLHTRHQIRSIPTLVIFRNGAEVARSTGALDAARLVAWINASL